MPYILDFRKVRDRGNVAAFLGVTVEILDELLLASEQPDTEPRIYVRHRIPKKRGSLAYRVVWDIASKEGRNAHVAFCRRFGDFSEKYIAGAPSPSAFGYVKGRSIKDNASKHCGCRWLFRCDIKDFFSSIRRDDLRLDFRRWGLAQDAADCLATLATIEGSLALGLNASPLLANLHCIDLDESLRKISDASGCVYTRYSDDIAISGNELPLKEEILSALDRAGFQSSPKKLRVTKAGQAQFVTGLSITDPAGPRLPRRFKSGLRQELYYARELGLKSHFARRREPYQRGVNRLDGSVRYAVQIEESFGKGVGQLWRRILQEQSSSTSYSPISGRTPVNASLFVDESRFLVFGKPAVGVICIATENAQILRDHANAQLDAYSRNPFAPGEPEALELSRLHMTDAPESFRQLYFALLPILPFRAYIAYSSVTDSICDSTYKALLSSLLSRRMMAYDGDVLNIHAEGSSVVTHDLVTKVVENTFLQLKQADSRRPSTMPTVEVHRKGEDMGLLVADAMLWAFQRAVAGTQINEIDLKRFESLRDRYRYVLDIDSGQEFSRRRPITTGIQKPRR